MKPLLPIILLVCLVSCQRAAPVANSHRPDATDYKIYTVVLGNLLVLENDISSVKDSSNQPIITIKNPKRTLLLIDSTRTIPSDRIIQLKTYLTDVFSNLAKQNALKSMIDTCFGLPIRLHTFAGSTFRQFLQLDRNNGFMEIYKKFPGVSGIVEFSRIAYNADKQKAFVEICFYESPEYSFGLFTWLSNKDGVWIITDNKLDWITPESNSKNK
jgi:hypothetical protein